MPPCIRCIVYFALVELLDHLGTSDNLQWVTVAPRLAFHELVFSFSCLKENLMFMQQMAALTT